MSNKHGVAFVFPGQGSQSEGMLKDCHNHPIIKNTLLEANDALGFDLAQIITEGSIEALSKTEITQPALLTVSIALWRLWCETTEIRPIVMAGHSLGEYSALVASGILAFADAVQLVSKRGQYMQEAVPEGTGAMAAILGLDDEIVVALCHEAAGEDVLSAVNFNSPGQVVIAGTKAAVERGCVAAKERGAKRALMLAVSAPSHCALMKPAAIRLSEELEKITFYTPKIDVIHNVDVKKHQEIEAIKKALITQLYEPVRWSETIQSLSAQNITHIVECGPSKVLTGLIKRIDKEQILYNLFDQASLEATVDGLN